MHIVYWPLIRYIVHHWGTTHQQLILWATRSPVRKKALKKKMSKSFDECKLWGIKRISILLKSTFLKSWIDYCATLLQPVAYKQSDSETSSLPIRYNPTIKTIYGNSRTYSTYSFIPAVSVWNLVTLLLTGWLCRDELLECFRGEVDEAFVDADNDDTDLDSRPADLRV